MILEKNMEALAFYRPYLKEKFDEIITHDPTEIEEIFIPQKNIPILKLFSPKNNRSVFIGGKADPSKEAEEIADSLDLQGGETRCLIGMGMGHLPLEIVKRKIPRQHLILVEPSSKLFMKSMEYIDLTELIKSENVSILLGGVSNIQYVLEKDRASIYSVGVHISTYEPLRELMPGQHGRIVRQIKEAAKNLVGEIVSDKNLGLYSFSNITANFSTVTRSANLHALKDSMTGIPGVVVGAGPSLNSLIPALKKNCNKCIIVSVDSALPVLLKNGIKPHIVASLDFSEACYEKYSSISDEIKDIALCYLTAINPSAVKFFPSKYKFFGGDQSGFFFELRDKMPGYADIPNMQAVGHLAFFAAQLMGVSSIILAGFDLAYTNFMSHAEGMALPRNINFEKAEWIEDLDGNLAPTMYQMIGQKIVFEKLINASQIKCCNANKSGAKIAGAENIDLDLFFENMSQDEIKNIEEIIREKFDNYPKIKPDTILFHLNKRNRDTKLLYSKSLKIISKARELIKYNKTKVAEDSFRRKLKKLLADYDKFIDEFEKDAPGEVFYYVGQQEIIHHAKELDIELDKDDSSEADKVLKEIRLIDDAVKIRLESLKKIIDIFNEFKFFLETETALLPQTEEDVFFEKKEIWKKLVECYFRYNEFMEAELVCKKFLASKFDYDIANFYLISLIEQKKFKKAFDFINEKPDFNEKFPQIRQKIEKWSNAHIDKAYKYLSTTVEAAGSVPWAKKYACEVLEVFPGHEKALNLLEEIGKKQIKMSEKSNEQIEAAKLDEEQGVDKINLYINSRDYKKAQTFLTILCSKFPLSGRLKILFSRLNSLLAKKKEAVDAAYQAVSLEPMNKDIRFNAGLIFLENELYQESLFHFKFLLKYDEFSSLNEISGDISFQLGHYDSALKFYEKMFLSFPEKIEILKKIAAVFKEKGLFDAAQETLNIYNSKVKELK
jgi:tetratricopeptide (TPR) repeat protein